MARKQTLFEKVAREVINYGGIAATRIQAYEHALACCLSRLGSSEPNREQRARHGAELFAFGSRAVAITAEQAARLIQWDAAVAAGIV